MKEYRKLGIVFSNMHDDMLGELTEHRTLGSVPVGGRYRLIDFALSNMVNSGVPDVGVITKSNYQSLMDHIGSGREWDLSRKRGGLCILPPFSRQGSGIYRGRLEALSGIIGYLKHNPAEYVIMTDCDVIANINYNDIISDHIEKLADITVIYKKGTFLPEQKRDTNVLELDEDNRVTDVLIHPDLSGEQNIFLNMLVIKKELLERIVTDAISRNLYSFAKDVLQAKAHTFKINAYEFKGYSSKVNCMKSYFKTNMEMLDARVRSELFPRNKPIYTKVRDQVPAKYGLNSKVANTLIADGCTIDGEVENSIIFRGVKIGKGAKVKNSIIMQGTTIGDGAGLDYVITDKDVYIKDNRMLMGFTTYPIFISKGSVV